MPPSNNERQGGPRLLYVLDLGALSGLAAREPLAPTGPLGGREYFAESETQTAPEYSADAKVEKASGRRGHLLDRWVF